jgi:hypothetical protein
MRTAASTFSFALPWMPPPQGLANDCAVPSCTLHQEPFETDYKPASIPTPTWAGSTLILIFLP